MPQGIEGALDAKGLKFAVVVAKFNSFITERLLEGTIAALTRHGAADADITIVKVPGSWELPLVVDEFAKLGNHEAIIALGAVIRGDTPHFDYVAGEAAKGIGAIGPKYGLPVVFGVLTTNTLEQAIDRAGGKSGNKGYDAGVTAIEMANLIRRLRAGS
jgi:6,7-dimethyl-8-ribityllumazine synthase